MSGGEVTPVAPFGGQTRRIVLILSACALLGFIAWIINEYRIRTHEGARSRLLSQLSAAVISSIDEHDQAGALPAVLAARFGSDVMARYAWVTTRIEPAASGILLIERPELVDGEWCLAIHGDGHLKKLTRDDAIRIIGNLRTTLTVPAPSP